MKKVFLLAGLASLLFGSTLSAQKKDSIVTLPTVTVTSGTKVTAEVDKAFKKTFPDARNLKWYKLDKDYLAKFITEDMKHNALFKKNGQMKYDISFGYENNLPGEIRDRVQSAYGDYKITKAVNVKFSDRNVWVINLEGMKHYIMVQVEGDEMEEVQKITKSQ